MNLKAEGRLSCFWEAWQASSGYVTGFPPLGVLGEVLVPVKMNGVWIWVLASCFWHHFLPVKRDSGDCCGWVAPSAVLSPHDILGCSSFPSLSGVYWTPWVEEMDLRVQGDLGCWKSQDQSTRETASQRENSRDTQNVPLEYSTEYWPV